MAALLIAIPAPAGVATAQTPRVECSLARDTVFQGEPVDYEVAVLDAPASRPDLTTFTDFEVLEAGSQDVSSSHMTIVNGRMHREERVGVEYRYQLVPRRLGALVVPGPVVVHEGRNYSGNALALQVVPPDDQGRLRMRLSVDPIEIFPHQEATIELRIAVRLVDGDRRRRDPVALLAQLESFEPPRLRLPWYELPAELGAASPDAWLSPLIERGSQGGFAINDHRAKGMMPLLFDDRPRYALFPLAPRPASTDDALWLAGLDGAPDDWFVYRLERKLRPIAVGRHEFAAATLKGRFITKLEGREASLAELFHRSDTATLVVREPPAEGRPAAWRGAIGTFSLAADVAPTRARVGDPLTLTLKVRGSGNHAELAPPDLASDPAFTDSFRVHAGSAETVGKERVFTWSLRPLDAAVKAVPPIELPWFDPARLEYVAGRSAELAIAVTEAVALDPGAIVAAPGRSRTDALEAEADGLFAHDSDPRRLGDESVDWRAHAAAGALLPLLTLGLLSAHGAWRRRHADPLALRRRRAMARAEERLAALGPPGADAPAALRELRALLLGAVADACDENEAALTAREAGEALVARGVDPAVANEMRELVLRIDGARFGAATEREISELRQAATAVLAPLRRELERRGAGR
jgi:hypothetical protein